MGNIVKYTSILAVTYWIGFVIVASSIANKLQIGSDLFYLSLAPMAFFLGEFFLLRSATDRLIQSLKYKEMMPLYAFIGYFIGLYIFKPQEPYSENLGSVILALIPIVIAILFSNQPFRLKHFVFCYILLGALSLLTLNALYDLNSLSFQNRYSISESLNSFNPINFSRFCSILFLVSVLDLFQKRRYIYKLIPISLGIISITFVFISASRGSILGIIVSLLIFGIFYLNIKRKILIGLLLTLVTFFILQQYTFENTQIYDRTKIIIENGFSSTDRWYIFSEALGEANRVLLNPHGYKYFTSVYGMYPHNLIIESIVNYGLLGIVTILAIIIIGLVRCIKLFREGSLPIVLYTFPLVWLYLLVSSMFSGDVVINNQFFVFYILTIGLYRNKNKLNDKYSNASP